MAQGDAEIGSVMALMGNSAMILSGTAIGTIKLLSLVMKIGKKALVAGSTPLKKHIENWKYEDSLKEQFGDIWEFVKNTNGKFELVNMPLQWCDVNGIEIPKNKELLERFEQECRNVGIRIQVLPDLNGSDGLTQFAVASEDMRRFNVIYRDFLLNRVPHMGGMSYTQLTAMSGGQVVLKAIRIHEYGENDCKENPQFVKGTVKKEDLEYLKNCLDSYKVHYSILPDLKLGDGAIRVAFLPSEAENIKAALESYRNKLFPDEKIVTADVTMDHIMDDAVTNVDEYVSQADPAVKDIIYQEGPVADAQAENFQNALNRLKDHTKSVNSDEYVRAKNNPMLQEITIDVRHVEQAVGNYVFFRAPEPYQNSLFRIPADAVFASDNSSDCKVFLSPGVEYVSIVDGVPDKERIQRGDQRAVMWAFNTSMSDPAANPGMKERNTAAVKKIDSEEYVQSKNNPGLREITANIKLVREYPDQGCIVVRAPQTQNYYRIPMNECFVADNGETYTIFLDKSKSYAASYSGYSQELAEGKLKAMASAEEIQTTFDKVSRNMYRSAMDKSMAQQVVKKLKL